MVCAQRLTEEVNATDVSLIKCPIFFRSINAVWSWPVVSRVKFLMCRIGSATIANNLLHSAVSEVISTCRIHAQNCYHNHNTERKKLVYQACEERRQKAIEARRHRMSACEEPSDGVLIKFKYPNGHTNMSQSRSCLTLWDKMILPVKSLWCKKPHHQDQLRAIPPGQ